MLELILGSIVILFTLSVIVGTIDLEIEKNRENKKWKDWSRR